MLLSLGFKLMIDFGQCRQMFEHKKQLENPHQDKSECSLRIIGTMFFRTDHFLKASDGLMMVISSVQLSCPDTKTDIKKGAYAVIPCNPCNLSTYPIVY